MIVSGEFLVIEDDKAVIKTLEKKIDVYEFLLDFEKKIKTLDKEDVFNRLSSIKIGDSIKIVDFFSKECDEPVFRKNNVYFSGVYLKKHNGTDSRFDFSFLDELLLFKELDTESKKEYLDSFLSNVLKKINSKYNYIRKNETDKFYYEKLQEENVVFSRIKKLGIYYSTVGRYCSTYSFKELFLTRCSYEYGNTYDELHIFLNSKCKIIKVANDNGTPKGTDIDLLFFPDFSLEKVRDEINTYIENPKKYKKEFVKNNIRLLIETITLEEKSIPLVENLIERMKSAIINKTADPHFIKGYLESISQWESPYDSYDGNFFNDYNKKYSKKGGRSQITEDLYGFFNIPQSILEKKKRIEYFKLEINELIEMFH